MGIIETLYHRSYQLPARSNARALCLDAAENIHLHYRDLRVEFSLNEFIEFMEHMNSMYSELKDWRAQNPDWTESDPETFEDRFGFEFGGPKNKIKAHSGYWDDRISIEKKISGDYHIKWRNYRFEMNEEAFIRWLIAFDETSRKFKKEENQPYRKALQRIKTWLYARNRLRKLWLRIKTYNPQKERKKV